MCSLTKVPKNTFHNYCQNHGPNKSFFTGERMKDGNFFFTLTFYCLRLYLKVTLSRCTLIITYRLRSSPILEGFMWNRRNIKLHQQADLLGRVLFYLVLSEYANQSHKFTNLVIVTSSLFFSIKRTLSWPFLKGDQLIKTDLTYSVYYM